MSSLRLPSSSPRTSRRTLPPRRRRRRRFKKRWAWRFPNFAETIGVKCAAFGITVLGCIGERRGRTPRSPRSPIPGSHDSSCARCTRGRGFRSARLASWRRRWLGRVGKRPLIYPSLTAAGHERDATHLIDCKFVIKLACCTVISLTRQLPCCSQNNKYIHVTTLTRFSSPAGPRNRRFGTSAGVPRATSRFAARLIRTNLKARLVSSARHPYPRRRRTSR